MAAFPANLAVMPGSAHASRLLSLVVLLQARPGTSARGLAAELGVSVRTVYRDVDALAAVGVPVYAETGRNGGYRLVDGYRTQLTGLTPAEAAALPVLGLPAVAIALGLDRPARDAERKLRAALGPDQRAEADRLRGRFHVDLPSWYADAEDPPHLAAVVEAVLHDRRVRVTYRRWEEPREVERSLEPHGVVLKGGAWYVVATTHQPGRRRHPEAADLRTYRVASILALEATEARFARVPDLDLADHWAAGLAAFDARRTTATATVRIHPDLRARLVDHPSHPLTAAARAAGPHADVVALPIESLARAALDLLAFGAEVEVVDPPELRDELGRRGREVAALYS